MSDKLKQDIQHQREEIEKLNVEESQRIISSETTDRTIGELKADVEKLCKEKKALNGQVLKFKQTNDSLKGKLAKAEESIEFGNSKHVEQTKEFEKQIKYLQDQITSYNSKLETMKQTLLVSENDVSEARERNKLLESQLSGRSASDASLDLHRKCADAETTINDLRKRLQQSVAKIAKKQREVETMKDRVNVLEEEERTQNAVGKDDSKIQELKIKLDDANTLNADLQKELDDTKTRYVFVCETLLTNV